tara:strand:- start:309 stop:794 length:486 start_codon:yes stop_codon:yes gene_type:complete
MIKEETLYARRKYSNDLKNKFRAKVEEKPSIAWANLLEKNIKNVQLRSWAASVIWFTYSNSRTPSPQTKLWKMMDDHRQEALSLPDKALFDALEKIGLPHPSVKEGIHALTDQDIKDIDRKLQSGRLLKDVAIEYTIDPYSISKLKLSGRIAGTFNKKRNL